MAISPQPPETSVQCRLPNRPARRASNAVSPHAGVPSRLPTAAPPSLLPPAGRGSPRTAPARRARAAASGPAAESDLAPGSRSDLTFRHVLVDSALHLREAPLEVVAARRAAASSGSCNRARPSGRPRPVPPPSIHPPARARPSPAMARAGRAQPRAADRGAPSAQPRPPPPLPPPLPPTPGREFFPFSKWRPMPVAPLDDVIPLRLLRRSVPRGLPGAHRAPTASARAVSKLVPRSCCGLGKSVLE